MLFTRLAMLAALQTSPTALSTQAEFQQDLPNHPIEGQAQKGIDSLPDDIVIESYRDRAKLPTVTQSAPQVTAVRLRRLYEYSERLANCAARSRLSNISRLRAVVDGEFNSVTHAVAQDRLKRTYITCSESPQILTMTTPDGPPLTLSSNAVSGVIEGGSVTVDPAPLGHSIYDRGAFIIAAMKTYAPGLTLTKKDTGDPVVQQRFDQREIPRNRYRLPVDYSYFQVAVCMVRMEPNLSVRLAMGDGSARNGGLQATLINRARVCVGNARNVSVDATQFRLYIADAVYRWTVASRGTDSLIPTT